MDYAKMVPVSDYVIVQRDKAARLSQVIDVPESAEDPSRFGRVMACGPGALRPLYQSGDGERRFPMHTKVGDRVLLPGMGCDRVFLDPADQATELVILHDQQVVAIIRE